jgi:hypothetical protein
MRNRSMFWPFFLIASGIIWLLIELGTISANNLWALMYIWPFFLMAAGVGLILRSRWPIIRMFFSALIVLGMAFSIVFAPQLHWDKAPAWNFIHLGDYHNFDGSVRGSGVIVSQSREVSDFNSIEINYPVELTIQQGNVPSLKVEADDNLLPQLSTRVSGNTLYIEDSERDWTRRVYPTQAVKISLTINDLQRVDFSSAGSLQIGKFSTDRLKLSISGAGAIHLSELNAKSLSVDLSGAGSVDANGSVDRLRLDISGLGGFEGGNLASQSADVSISGAGSSTTWAKDSLSVTISGTGSVKYYGSPSVQRQISGLGSVTSLGNK